MFNSLPEILIYHLNINRTLRGMGNFYLCYEKWILNYLKANLSGSYSSIFQKEKFVISSKNSLDVVGLFLHISVPNIPIPARIDVALKPATTILLC